jgi:hypothetical protein
MNSKCNVFSALVWMVKLLCAAMSLAFIGLFILLAFKRITVPVQLNMLEGAMVEYMRHFAQGGKIYAAPTSEYVPMFYGPLYIIVYATVMKWFGFSFFTGRALSILFTLGALAVIGVWIRKRTGSWFYALLGAGLYSGFYYLTGFYYDTLRTDSLLAFLLVLGVFLSFETKGLPGGLAAGIVLAAAFFTKQHTVAWVAAIAAGYFWSGERHKAFWLLGAFSVPVIIGLTIVFKTCGYPAWFCLFEALTKYTPYSAGSWISIWFVRVLQGAPAVLAAGLLLPFISGRQGEKKLWTMLLPAVILLSIMHSALIGASVNSLMPLFVVLAPAAAIALHYCDSLIDREKVSDIHKAAARTTVYGVVIAQLLLLLYKPSWAVIPPHYIQEEEALVAYLKGIEGDVYIPYFPHLLRAAGKKMYANYSFVNNMCPTGIRSPYYDSITSEFESLLADNRFAAVLTEESVPFNAGLRKYYRLIARRPQNEIIDWAELRRSTEMKPGYLFIPNDAPAGAFPIPDGWERVCN